MAFTKFPVVVQTPEGTVFDGDVEMISTRTTTGTLGVRAHHQPIMAMLDPTELRLYRGEDDIVRFAQAEGYLQMAGNSALMLVEEAIPVGELDEAVLTEQLAEAQTRINKRGEGSAAHERALRDAGRAEMFLSIARGDAVR